MSNISDRERFNRLDTQIWERKRVDRQGRVTLPLKLRKKLGLNRNGGEILWISCNRKKNHDNEFLIELGVKK
jgi:bifunctional DNA-binding transcriptional regulator/antitoxin component of YhaV-PrlF toxin-antitoxin module